MIDFRDLDPIDLKLKLLKGGSLTVDNIKLNPYTLDKIIDMGFTNLMTDISFLSISLEDLLELFDESRREIMVNQNIKIFDILIGLGGDEVRENFINSLRVVLNARDIRILNKKLIAVDFLADGIIYVDDNGDEKFNYKHGKIIDIDNYKIIDRNNYDDVIKAIKLLYSFPDIEEVKEEPAPVDERTRKLKERMDELRNRVKEVKASSEQDGGSIDFYNLIDAISSKSNSLNKLNIWNLTFYQLYAEYLRLEKIEESYIGMQAMMAGAKDIKPVSWLDNV